MAEMFVRMTLCPECGGIWQDFTLLQGGMVVHTDDCPLRWRHPENVAAAPRTGEQP